MSLRGVKELLLITGILLTLGLTGTVTVAGSGSGSGGDNDERVTLAEADYDVEVEFREGRGLVVDVELEGAPPGEYQVIMREGGQQTVLGFVTVDATGEADVDFPIDLGEGEHVISFVIRNEQITLMTTGGLTLRLPLANEAEASSSASASAEREMEQEKNAEAEIEEDEDILDFETMFPVSGPWVGSGNPIRGVNGGGLPWVIGEADGELRVNGRLEVKVKGLVLADDPAVPENLRLTNPIGNFRAIVSCISLDAEGNPVGSNISTELFPATPRGDAEIETVIDLPEPCLAPVIFVTHPNGAWFAVTGN